MELLKFGGLMFLKGYVTLISTSIFISFLLITHAWGSGQEPSVLGYPGYGTPQQEEQWYREHAEWCLNRIMSKPKEKGFVGIYRNLDLARKNANTEWGKKIVQNMKGVADWWAAQSDEFLYNSIPKESPDKLVVSYNFGCPIHGGYRATFQPDLSKLYHYYCERGGEWWYPGCVVRNPASGEEITVVDNGKGWKAPAGFPNAGQFYYFKQAWPTALLKKYLWGNPYGGEKNRKDPPGDPPVISLSVMYALTGDLKYAHAQGILLNRLAETYRNYLPDPDFWGNTRWRNAHRICPVNFEPEHLQAISIAFDLAFEGIKQDKSIVKLFSTKGNADYDGDGQLTANDITYNIQKNLFGYMYEFMHRFPTIGQGADVALASIAVTMQNPEIALEAMNNLNQKLVNQFYRDGLYWEDSSGYQDTAFGYLWAVEWLSAYYDNIPINKAAIPLKKAGSILEKYLDAEWKALCDGRLLAIGDTGNTRDAIGPKIPYYSWYEYAYKRFPNLKMKMATLIAASTGKKNEPYRKADWGAGRYDSFSLWLLFNAEPIDFSNIDNTNPLEESVLFDGAGYAVLRSGKNISTRKHLLFYFSQSGTGHGHADQLHLQPIAYGYDLSAEVGYWLDDGPKWYAFTRNTVSHNTVEVDMMGQRVQSVGTLKMYGITPTVKVIEAEAGKVYEQCNLYRRLSALIEVGLSDIPKALSG